MSKTELIKLRVSPDEKATWQAAAREAGVALSELIRRELNGLVVNKPLPVSTSAPTSPEFVAYSNVCAHGTPTFAWCGSCNV